MPHGRQSIYNGWCSRNCPPGLTRCWDIFLAVLIFILYYLCFCWCCFGCIFFDRRDKKNSDLDLSSSGGGGGRSSRYGGQGWGDSTEVAGYDQNSGDRYRWTNPFPSAPPKSRINIKAGKGATIIAGEDTLQNAQIDVESRTGQNNIVALGHNGNYTVTTADGRLQKDAGGEFVHTGGNAVSGGSRNQPELTYP